MPSAFISASTARPILQDLLAGLQVSLAAFALLLVLFFSSSSFAPLLLLS